MALSVVTFSVMRHRYGIFLMWHSVAFLSQKHFVDDLNDSVGGHDVAINLKIL